LSPLNEEPKDQAAFLEKSGYTFHSMVEPTEQVKNLYRVGGISTTVLIDKEGLIQVYELGGHASLREALLKRAYSDDRRVCVGHVPS
jgi:hypothetical protein